MERETAVVSWFIDPIRDFSYTKTISRNPRKYRNCIKSLEFFNKSRNNSYLFKIGENPNDHVILDCRPVETVSEGFAYDRAS
jgi:hypothetical protein